ncbi:MAG: efflux RND transporter periplasmic adaptor subunit [Gammaproteobacteria bacterium]|nr:efflux RND transporter periplasmic adaptor subunit [Gammaproteobacteria bacterium]
MKTITVEPVPYGLQRSYPAVVLPAREVALSFRVSGRIVELPIRAMMQVEKGEVIAQLDMRDFEAEIAQLESQYAQAEAQLRAMRTGARAEDIAALEAAVEASEAQVEAERQQFKRTQTLLDKGVVTRVRLETDETALRVGEADLRARKQELAKGQAGARAEDVEAQEAVIRGLNAQLKTAGDNLADATLRAPFDGIIAKREVENFANVQAKDPIALLQNLETLELIFDVPGPDVSKLAAAHDVSSVAILDAIPGKEFEARLVEFSTQADLATQTYRARVAITPPEDASILPGMVGTVVVSEPQTETSVVSVPVSAVASEPDGTAFVWVVDPASNAVQKRPVETAEASGATIIVSAGLAAGDIVVTAGLSQLQPDMVVRPVSEIGD